MIRKFRRQNEFQIGLDSGEKGLFLFCSFCPFCQRKGLILYCSDVHFVRWGQNGRGTTLMYIVLCVSKKIADTTKFFSSKIFMSRPLNGMRQGFHSMQYPQRYDYIALILEVVCNNGEGSKLGHLTF